MKEGGSREGRERGREVEGGSKGFIVCVWFSATMVLYHTYSAGVGRTGTFICIDNVLEQIKKENVVDLAGIINKMRHQRMKMVQTPVSTNMMY